MRKWPLTALLFSVQIFPVAADGTDPNSHHYPHATYSMQHQGMGSDEYWIFTPEQPQPAQAPIIVFLHGWGGMDPFAYGAWILHLVKRGNIVIYPRYQTNIKTKFAEMTPNALRAVQTAYKQLAESGPVRPAPGKFAIAGHSMGGFIAANLAAMAKSNGLPEPGALMIIAPGDGDGRMLRLGRRLDLVDLSTAPESMLVLVVTANADRVVGDRGADKIWGALGRSKVSEKEYLKLAAAKEHSLRLVADHLSPLAADATFDPEYSLYRSGAPEEGAVEQPKGFFARRHEARSRRIIDRNRKRAARGHEPDAVDYEGYWKLLDDLLETAFAGPKPDQDVVKKWRGGFDQDHTGNPVRIMRCDREAHETSNK